VSGRVPPRIEVLDPNAARLEAPEALPPALPPRRMGTLALSLAGAAVLAFGLAGLSIGNFVADQFARSAALGWATLGVAGLGGGLLLAGLGRELRALWRLDAVDRLRARLADPSTRRQAALDWLATLPEGGAVAEAVRRVNDPDAVLALLRDGPAARLRGEAEALGRRGAFEVFALTAAVPSPALDALAVAWRGLRLIRQVGELHGMRPGIFATVALLRRTLVFAGTAAFANVAVDTVARMMLSHPQLAHLAGDAAGSAVASRRMIVLARAAAAACSPVEEDDRR
jgi:putative membrane protein